PAVVVNYYGPTFSSAVHSAQRVYNDYEDYQETSVQTVPESGFNIYSDGDREGFFTLINGPEEVENSLVRLEVFNHKGDRLEGTIELGPLAPYQCEWVTLSDHMDLQDFLEGQVGCCKMHFAVNWIYPRLIVGNYLQSKHALNVTHSYYDCTDAKSSGDYWHSAMEDWYPANLMLPLTVGKGEVTNAYFYPIISPSTLAIHAEIYSASGQLLGRKERALTIRSPAQSQYCIPFQEICRELDIDTHQSLGGRVLCETIEGGRIPARLKIGLDLGFTGKGLPCNVCTNLLPFNPSLEHKPHCFRWAPILADQEHSSVWLLNSSPAKAYHRSATVNLVFFREEDDHTLTRQITLAPHGHLRIAAEGDDELRSFLKGRIGWFTASSDCPYISSYFFTQHASGVVGGDHGF
ncbi:MAG: hypothetical protein KDK78_00740, partial [Chlamydiia bacterium]|nr:hypothetical protein [Chlamydiia bacterium]